MIGRFLFLALALGVAVMRVAPADKPLYDEMADAAKNIRTTIRQASRQHKNIVLVFGANWCTDCHALDHQMHQPELAALIDKHFVVVKIDVGRFDKNLDLAAKYQVPLERGIPAVAVLNPHGKLLYAQDQGQFADARHMDDQAFKAFFEEWKPKG